jgi:hypothetical protein
VGESAPSKVSANGSWHFLLVYCPDVIQIINYRCRERECLEQAHANTPLRCLASSVGRFASENISYCCPPCPQVLDPHLPLAVASAQKRRRDSWGKIYPFGESREMKRCHRSQRLRNSEGSRQNTGKKEGRFKSSKLPEYFGFLLLYFPLLTVLQIRKNERILREYWAKRNATPQTPFRNPRIAPYQPPSYPRRGNFPRPGPRYVCVAIPFHLDTFSKLFDSKHPEDLRVPPPMIDKYLIMQVGRRATLR